MFPTLSSLIEYLTGVTLPLPIQTFGFFVALSFWLSYIAFKKEFIRKEKLGLIHPFAQKTTTGKAPAPFALTIQAVAAFFIGYKIVYCLLLYKQFLLLPAAFIFSWNGNIPGGIIAVVPWLVWIYAQRKRRRGTSPVTTRQLIHPYEYTDKLLLWCAVVGFVGALLFAKLEYIDQLFQHPIIFLTEFSGLAFYGGLIFGAGIYFYITKKKMGIPFLVAADIGSPGMMLAYGVGRLGCHLSGDGDWGIVNTAPKPGWLSWAPDWAWAFNYPHNVIHQGKYIEGCTGHYCNVLADAVFPTSFYEASLCLSLFALLWFFRNKIRLPGMMFFIFLVCNGAERFMIEFIKINPTHCTFICISQAQYISLIFCITGVGGLLWLLARKRRT